MPEIIIDDRQIQVPEGTKVIEAAEQMGIMIPRFCYHLTVSEKNITSPTKGHIFMKDN